MVKTKKKLQKLPETPQSLNDKSLKNSPEKSIQQKLIDFAPHKTNIFCLASKLFTSLYSPMQLRMKYL